MFSIGDSVCHRNTGYVGKVIGYGYELFDSVYTTTLKVLLTSNSHSHYTGVMEDLLINWVQAVSQDNSVSTHLTTPVANYELTISPVKNINSDSAVA